MLPSPHSCILIWKFTPQKILPCHAVCIFHSIKKDSLIKIKLNTSRFSRETWSIIWTHPVLAEVPGATGGREGATRLKRRWTLTGNKAAWTIRTNRRPLESKRATVGGGAWIGTLRLRRLYVRCFLRGGISSFFSLWIYRDAWSVLKYNAEWAYPLKWLFSAFCSRKMRASSLNKILCLTKLGLNTVKGNSWTT